MWTSFVPSDTGIPSLGPDDFRCQVAEECSVQVVIVPEIQSQIKVYNVECQCYSLLAQTPPLITAR